ncbi:HEAT repeat domain-containing protein [Treponema sp. R80B11-R83G3]
MLVFIFLINFSIHAQEASRQDTIKYGTETEIAALIQTIRTENTDLFDDELIALAQTSKNTKVLTGILGFFGDREKSGLQERAIKAVKQREDEATETVLSALDYLGKMKTAEAVPVIKELLDTEEKRFLSAGFRAIGGASSGDKKLADETAQFLVDFYNDREPGNENRSIIINAIGATGSSAGVDFLTEIATNPDERFPLRIAALGALSKIGDPKGLDAIISCVNANDQNVRSSAVAALGPFQGSAAENAILDAFRDSYYRTRIAAAQASRDRKLAAAVPFLKFRAERDDVPNVKDEAIRALGAIANNEAITVLDGLFSERKNTDRVRILAADMLMKNTGGKNFSKLIVELDEAKRKNQTNLYNGFLKVVGEAAVENDKSEIEGVARRFMAAGIMEKLYALDMANNNKLTGLKEEILTLTKDRNESISRKARRTAESLGIEIPNN